MSVPRLSFVGWSGAGKTTVLEALLPRLTAVGLRVGVIKHSSHEHPLHATGSDTERLARSGAAWVGLQTPEGLQLTQPPQASWTPPCDLLLVEGDKNASGPKIEITGPGPLLAQADAEIFALIGHVETPPRGIPVLAPDDLDRLTELVSAWWKAQRSWSRGRQLGTAVRPVLAVPARPGDLTSPPPAVAVEEPLEIRVAGEALATTMRTPGHDDRLAVGFLWAEGVIRSRQELGHVVHCGSTNDPGYGNVIDVAPAPGVLFDVEKVRSARRGTLVTSACGVCGRQNIDDLLRVRSPLPPGPQLSADLLRHATSRLAPHQALFQATAGTHAAAVLDDRGEVQCLFEDVGRHNAVDKAVGELVYRGWLDPGIRSPATLLVVSGRASFEIVQKAAMAGLPFVVSVSAASSLAVDLAERAGVTLVTFARGRDFLLYTHGGRVLNDAPQRGDPFVDL